MPENASVLIEEADLHLATRQLEDLHRDETISLALRQLEEKACHLILTTVDGGETQIDQSLVESALEHITCFMDAESRELTTIHRTDRYLIPSLVVPHDAERVSNAMALSFAFRPMRNDVPEESTVGNADEDYSYEVRPVSFGYFGTVLDLVYEHSSTFN